MLCIVSRNLAFPAQVKHPEAAKWAVVCYAERLEQRLICLLGGGGEFQRGVVERGVLILGTEVGTPFACLCAACVQQMTPVQGGT